MGYSSYGDVHIHVENMLLTKGSWPFLMRYQCARFEAHGYDCQTYVCPSQHFCSTISMDICVQADKMSFSEESFAQANKLAEGGPLCKAASDGDVEASMPVIGAPGQLQTVPRPSTYPP